MRECLQDVFDVPGLVQLMRDVTERTVRIVDVETQQPSPMARSLLFGYIGQFMYEGDSPLAERRAAALSLDPTLLAELLGRAELRELLDPKVLEQTELELQRLAPDRRARDLEGVVDLLRVLGPLSLDEIVARTAPLPEPTSLPELVEGRPADTGSGPSLPTGTADRFFESLGTGGVGPSSGNDIGVVAGWLDELTRAHRVLPARIAGSERWAIIEDASRLRDALGVALPIGVPVAFVDPVADPVGDLVSRYARTHGPFTALAVAERFGLGVAVVLDSLRRLGSDRRVVEGEFRPGASGSEWVDSEILRRLRSRSLAALRQEVEPVSQDTLGRFLPAWQHVSTDPSRGLLHGADGLLRIVEQLGGVALPASAWETLVLPARLRDYSQAWLDELTVSGEVLWSGAGVLPGSDGWVSLHIAETAAVTLAPPADLETTELQREILVALAGGGAYFFRQLGSAVGSTDDRELAAALWDLVWAGLVTNDTFAPLRSFLGGKAAPRRAPRARAYRGRTQSLLTAQSGPPTVAGRWSLLPLAEGDTTVRAKATAEALLDRHGIVTRGAVTSEGIRGGFALAYKVLSTFEETGRARRGYFVDGLGGAQFGTGATVDRLRQFARDPDALPDLDAITLAATDPANAYGAALAWPATEGHRPGRKAGALVVLVDGRLVAYIERGGKTVLTFSEDEAVLGAAAGSLAATVRGGLGRLRVERVDGEFSIGTLFGTALTNAGFAPTPQGLRLRA
jgi:ATP-dependent Lhr-like helicase